MLSPPVPDPEYYFLKPLPRHQTGYLGRSLRLSCLCSEEAETIWLRDGEEVSEEEERCMISRQEGESVLELMRLGAGDSGQYTCKIVKFGREGEDTTACRLSVIGNLRVRSHLILIEMFRLPTQVCQDPP